MDVEIPIGSTATIHIPTLGQERVQISNGNQPIWRDGETAAPRDSVKAVQREGNAVVVEADSGGYHFQLESVK